MKIISAEYILPISESPIKNGAIAIESDKIIAVGKRGDLLKKFPEAIYEDFGDSAIMPGLVNCHTHLELTAMRGFLDRFDDDFYSWLITLTKTRAENLTNEDVEISAMLGALEGLKSGITCFGDIGRWGTAGFNALIANGGRGILFQETEFSPDDKTAESDFEKLIEKFSVLKESETSRVKVGISPHAPYTVSRKLFEKISDFAIRENIKITIHAAESEQEQNLMQNGEGFFAKLYQEQEINWESPQCSTIQYLERIGVLEAKPILAHCVKVSETDISLISKSHSKIAHCPKSNAKFGHGIAPFEKFLNKNIKVGFGSDSMASNNTCDILEESRFATLLARTLEDKERFIHAEEIIKTATFGGAEALGLDKKIGTLEAGKQADLIVISLDATAQQPVHDVYTTILFATSGKDVSLTMVNGEEICRNGISTKVDEEELTAKMKEISNKM